jgi:hypothetical protein
MMEIHKSIPALAIDKALYRVSLTSEEMQKKIENRAELIVKRREYLREI